MLAPNRAPCWPTVMWPNVPPRLTDALRLPTFRCTPGRISQRFRKRQPIGQLLVPGSPAAGRSVTINYHAPITIHGTGPDMEHRLAAYHRRHIDQMTRDLEEVVYRRNRSAFD